MSKTYHCSQITKGKVDSAPALVSKDAICFYLVEPETGVVKERRIQTVSRFLVTNMGLFFIPSLVGTMEYVEVLRAQALPFLAVTFLTTPVVYLAAAWTVQLLMRRSRKEAGRHV